MLAVLALREDLLPQDVGMAAVLSQLPKKVEIDPSQGQWAPSISVNHIV
jgi:hypothetical protein